ncbi:MAG TPA: ROK family protein [Candidatus Angelobacter sp.]|nr:ROK family protein [Candidatus Angelobacter sp.]
MNSFAIGVDLGGTNLRIAAVDAAGTVLEKISTDAAVARGRDYVLDEMCNSIRGLAAKLGGSGELTGIGIGVPGIIDRQTGLVHASPNLPDWRDYPVRDEIERRLRTNVVLENDANAAALGEKWLGIASQVDDMCMLTLGTGVGGGIVLRGKIWHGMTGMAGELGHTTVYPLGVKCGCGNYGCLEQYASATAVKRMAREAIDRGDAPELAAAMHQDPELSAKGVYQIAVQGDEPAHRIFQSVGQSLGIALASAINIFNLPMYVIGGGVSNAWDAFAPAMFDEVRKRSFVYTATAPKPDSLRIEPIGAEGGAPSRQSTIIARASLGSDAGLFGAARLALNTDADHLSEPEPNQAQTGRSGKK